MRRNSKEIKRVLSPQKGRRGCKADHDHGHDHDHDLRSANGVRAFGRSRANIGVVQRMKTYNSLKYTRLLKRLELTMSTLNSWKHGHVKIRGSCVLVSDITFDLLILLKMVTMITLQEEPQTKGMRKTMIFVKK